MITAVSEQFCVKNQQQFPGTYSLFKFSIFFLGTKSNKQKDWTCFQILIIFALQNFKTIEQQ
jgi:hypothetical protein